MKLLKYFGCSAILMSAAMLQAQDAAEVEQLKKKLQQLQEQFEKAQNEHQKQMKALMQQIDGLQQKQSSLTADQQQLKDQMSQPMADAAKASSLEKGRWRPSDPISLLQRDSSYLNLSLSGLFAAGGSTANDLSSLQLGGHDPSQRGFTVQNVEAVFEGAVDPYFRGQANTIFFIDRDGETVVELEEAYLESLSLPWNLQLKAGQYYTEFGRHNPTHPHAWAFVDIPLVNGRFLGPDGLRNPGARLSWLMPTPFYSELFLGVQNSHGETAFSFRSGEGHGHEGESEGLPFAFRENENDRGVRNLDDLLLAPRYAVSFDLTDTQTLLLGASGAFGPNSSGESGNNDTQIYGADLTWKWRSSRHQGGFPFVTWQTEGMLRNYRAGSFDWDEEGDLGDADGNGFPDEGVLVDASTGLPAAFSRETLTDYGFYSQVLYGFRKGWVAGLRFDFVTGSRGDYEKLPLILADNAGGGASAGRDLLRRERWRFSPNLTWYPSEFSKVRLQYNYDDRRDIGVDHSVWLQLEFLLGSHAAHKF